MKTLSALFAALIVAATLSFTAAQAASEEQTVYVKTAADWFDQE